MVRAKGTDRLFNAILIDPTPIVEAMKLHYDPALPNSLVVTDAMISASDEVDGEARVEPVKDLEERKELTPTSI